MIRSITLENFKIFQKKTLFPFKKINLLTGINGRGKSSLIQSILLFKQSVDRRNYSNKLYLSGEFVNIGNFADLRNDEISISQPVKIAFGLSQDYSGSTLSLNISYSLFRTGDEMVVALNEIDFNTLSSFYLRLNQSEADLIRLRSGYKAIAYRDGEVVSEMEIRSLDSYLTGFFPSSFVVSPVEDLGIGFFSKFVDFSRIHYLSSERLGPRNYYEKKNLPDFVSVGAHGEYSANVLSTFGNEIKVNEAMYLGHSSKALLSQCQEWMSYLFDGAVIEVQGKDIESATLSLLMNTKSTNSRFKPTNVGFGFSYALPIIVSGLLATDGDILIVENPEGHLHPRAQSRIVKFLSRVAKLGVQVVVESHSEHVLNALRIESISDNGITADDISILFFYDGVERYFEEIGLNRDGKIENWISGFFDQSDEDYRKLIDF